MKGIGRFEPWGANSNQTGVLFALAVPLFAYAAMTYKNVSLKPFFIFALSLAVGMALLTGSRQTMIAIIMVMIPILMVMQIADLQFL